MSGSRASSGGSPATDAARRVDVAVIGGGLAGLAAAHRALERGASVALCEATDRLGGLVRTERHKGFVIERGPESFLTKDPILLELAERVGIGNRVIRTRARGAKVAFRGRLEAIPAGFQLLAPTDARALWRSPLLSPAGKLRALLEPLVVVKARPVDDESLGRFVRRRFGDELLIRLAQPLASGIYGADPERLGLRSTLPRFLDAEQQKGSVIRGLQASGSEAAAGARYGLFASFDHGMQVLTDALAATLQDGGAWIHLTTPVQQLDALRDGWTVQTPQGAVSARSVVLATAPGISARLLAPHDAAAAAPLTGPIALGSASTVTLAYDDASQLPPLSTAGFVVPAIEGRAVLAATYSSAKWEGRAPEGKALVRVFLGGHTGQDVVHLSDAALQRLALRGLRELVGITALPLFSRVDRWIEAMPRYEVGHRQRMESLAARMHGVGTVRLAGSAYAGVGMPAVAAGARAAIDELLA